MNTTFKNSMRELMSKAWMLVKTYGYTLSEAMKQMWRIYKLKKAMTTKIVKFYYQKVDGSVREAWGTLCEALIPTHTNGDGRKPSNSVQVYWDKEKDAFRCFKVANFISMAV